MSNEEKLQAIRQQAQREKAERLQRDQAGKVNKEDRQNRRTGIRVKDLLVIPVSLAVGLWLWNHYSQPEPEKEDSFDEFEAVFEARDSAVAYATLHHLQRKGWNIDLISDISAQPLDTNDHFKIQFGYQGKRYQVVAHQACQPNVLDFKTQSDPDCYIWK